MEISGVILAGGKSSRMGRDKSLLPFGQKSLVEYQYGRLKSIFKNLYISTKSDKFPFEAPLIYDRSLNYSPLVAIKDILEEIDSLVFIISVDLPFVKIESIKRLLLAYKKGVEVVLYKSVNGLEPLCGIYSPLILDRINSMLKDNNHRLRDLIKAIPQDRVEILENKSSLEFLNLNYYSDYQKALELLEKNSQD